MGRPPRQAEFFRVWTPEMAYVLGYWWADGYMYIKPSTGAHEIEFASIDREHLQLIADIIGINYHMRLVSKTSNCYEITYCSKEMYRDLEALGGTPRKSRTISMPSISSELLPHFIRGFVDGDGTLSWNGDRPILQIYSASTELLTGMGRAIEAMTGIPAPQLASNRDRYYIKWSTIRAKCLAAWLYVEHPGLVLARKSVIAAHFLEWKPRKRPEKGTITEEMRRHFPAYLPI